ncbi:MAG TPA: hypothetical protein VFP46_00480 [Candidatus Paceibacterota bacterium]|nr:hypothetical protein [Candidatus Paceibacterota bacterium]
MHKLRTYLPFSPLSVAVTLVAILIVTYIGLIATVMSYAALTVEFSQSVRSDESVVAKLESAYLDKVARITAADYTALGYAKPAKETFVRSEGVTALR